MEEEQDGKEEEPPENLYENYEEFEPNFLEPIMMTEMWSGNEKKFVYHYPKTTVVTFRCESPKNQIETVEIKMNFEICERLSGVY